MRRLARLSAPGRAGWLVLAVLLLFASGLNASPPQGHAPLPRLPAGLAEGPRSHAVDVRDGDTLSLAGGDVVRLVGIQAPKLPLGRAGMTPWPLAEEAREALESLVDASPLQLHFGGARRDRHGRWLAHLSREDGVWIQGALLAMGLARVYSFEDNRTAVAEMLVIEAMAREQGLGIWSEPFYAIVSTEQAERDPRRYRDSFQIVEGRVLATAIRRNHAYVNFGENWRTDFTIAIARRHLPPFRTAFGETLERLEGRTIRVRGWMGVLNGPMIEATHPEQIEILP